MLTMMNLAGGGGWFGGGGAQLSAHDDKGGWGGGCSVAADAVTAEVGCDFDRRLVSTDGGKDGPSTRSLCAPTF